MNLKEQTDITIKLEILTHAKSSNNVAKTCRFFGISRTSYYAWKKAYENFGEQGLINNESCTDNPRLRIATEIEEKILYLRQEYQCGPLKISWYLKQLYDMKVSRSGCYYVLLRNGQSRLPKRRKKRMLPEFDLDKNQAINMLTA